MIINFIIMSFVFTMKQNIIYVSLMSIFEKIDDTIIFKSKLTSLT